MQIKQLIRLTILSKVQHKLVKMQNKRLQNLQTRQPTRPKILKRVPLKPIKMLRIKLQTLLIKLLIKPVI